MAQTSQGIMDAYNALFSDTMLGSQLRQQVRRGLAQRLSSGDFAPRKRAAGAAVPNAGVVGVESPSNFGGGGFGTPGGYGPGVSRGMSIGPSGAVDYGSGLPAGWSPTSTATSGIGFRGWSPSMAKKAASGGMIAAGPVGAGLGFVGGGLLGGLTRYSPRFPGNAMPRNFTGEPGVTGGFSPSFSPVADRSKFGMGFGGSPEPGVGEVGGYGGAGFDSNSPNPDPGGVGGGYGGFY